MCGFCVFSSSRSAPREVLDACGWMGKRIVCCFFLCRGSGSSCDTALFAVCYAYVEVNIYGEGRDFFGSLEFGDVLTSCLQVLQMFVDCGS